MKMIVTIEGCAVPCIFLLGDHFEVLTCVARAVGPNFTIVELTVTMLGPFLKRINTHKRILTHLEVWRS